MKVAWLFLFSVVVLGQTRASEARHFGDALYDSEDPGIVLNEILADPPDGDAGDANQDGVRHTYADEFVEIYNTGPDTVDLGGWQLVDAQSVRHVFPDTVDVLLLPGEFVTVFGGGEPSGFAGGVWVASSGRLSLNNGEDRVSLVTAWGDTVDVHEYGSEAGNDESMIRVPDGTGAWTRPSEQGWDTPFSPQGPNCGDTAAGDATWGQVKRQYRLHG